MSDKTLQNKRKKIGAKLKALREKEDISKYKIHRGSGMKYDQIDSLERGSSNYTIDSLLKHLSFIGYELVFVKKEEKEKEKKENVD